LYNAIDKIVKIEPKLEDYSIKALSSEKEAMGEVKVGLIYNNSKFYGIGSSTDIIEASAIAYLNAINRILTLENR